MKNYKEIFQDAWCEAKDRGMTDEQAAAHASNSITDYYAAMADRAKDEAKERKFKD